MPIKAKNITIYSIFYDNIDFDNDLVPGIVPGDGGHRFVIELTSGAAIGERREITNAGTTSWNDKDYFKLNSISNLSSGDFFRVIQLVVPNVDNFSLRDVCIVINPNNNTLQDCFNEAEGVLFDPAYKSSEYDSLYCFRNYGAEELVPSYS